MCSLAAVRCRMIASSVIIYSVDLWIFALRFEQFSRQVLYPAYSLSLKKAQTPYTHALCPWPRMYSLVGQSLTTFRNTSTILRLT